MNSILYHVCYLANFFSFFFGSQVVRCCLEHAASVAKTVTSGAVVVEIKELETVAAGSPMANQGFCLWPQNFLTHDS